MSTSTALILGAAVALPLLITSLVSRARHPPRTTRIPKSQERVVIIGASSGIGAELARIYAHRHAHVVVVARRIELLQQLIQELSPVAGSIHAIQADVSLTDDVRRLTIESLRALQGGIDTLIICAGIISVLPFEELAGIDYTKEASPKDSGVSGSEQESFDHLLPTNSQAALDASVRIMNVNYHAPLNLACHFLPSLTRTSVAGNIIVVSSMAGKVGAPTRSIYSGSKHAAQGFFESLGMEVERKGVHVGIVSPGTVITDLRHSAVDLPPPNTSGTVPGPNGGDGANSSGNAEPTKISGTKKGAMSARACAEGIVQGSDLRQHDVVMPWFYHVSLVLKLFNPGLVRRLAKKKYGYL
ncbi:hypothetical protein B0O80DRAFT_478132 [Mortierella sp. GBAus27b]|nr:hypothetical protein BGX31_010166 [Mortierella sp. GBA43]KAI8354937.1 hypothetical protein B0O80DRAFT_478132 [Mortierella sp. GBAus27b]